MKVLPWVKFKTIEGKNICKLLFNAGLLSPDLDCDSIAKNLHVVFSGDLLKYPDFDVVYLYAEKIIDINHFELYPECAQNNYTPKNKDINLSDYVKNTFAYGVNGKKRGRPVGSFKEGPTYQEKFLAALREKNAPAFPEKITGEILTGDKNINDLDTKKELYLVTIQTICSNFMENNPELVKTPLKNWINKLYVEIKHNIPKIDYKTDIELLSYVFDIYCDMCFSIGGTPTINGFCIMVGLPWYRFKEWTQKKQQLSPSHNEFLKKALYNTENNLVNGLVNSSGANTNTMFLLNTVYGYDKKTTVEHVTTSIDHKTIDDIPLLDDIQA